MGSTAVGSDRRWFGGNGTFRHESRPGPHILEGVEAVSLLVSNEDAQVPSVLLAYLAPARQAPRQPRFGASHHGASLATCKKFTLRKKKVPLRKSRRHEDAHTQAMARSQHTHWNVKRRGASDAGHGMPGGSSLGRGTENKAPTGPQENTLTHNNPTLL